MREYRNFEEIERDLELLKLQKEVDKEKAKLDYQHTKFSLTPKNIAKRAGALCYLGASKVMGFVADKMQR